MHPWGPCAMCMLLFERELLWSRGAYGHNICTPGAPMHVICTPGAPHMHPRGPRACRPNFTPGRQVLHPHFTAVNTHLYGRSPSARVTGLANTALGALLHMHAHCTDVRIVRDKWRTKLCTHLSPDKLHNAHVQNNTQACRGLIFSRLSVPPHFSILKRGPRERVRGYHFFYSRAFKPVSHGLSERPKGAKDKVNSRVQWLKAT